MKSITKGWVVKSKDDIIFDYTFKMTRSNSIKTWLSLWSKPNWRKDKRDGCKCVKATMTIEVNKKE